MTDKLNMAHINALPQPFMLRTWGSDIWWPVHDIEVETGLLRIDVCGKLQVMHIGDVADFRDDADDVHDPESFYLEIAA